MHEPIESEDSTGKAVYSKEDLQLNISEPPGIYDTWIKPGEKGHYFLSV
jgi:hypothetical protein